MLAASSDNAEPVDKLSCQILSISNNGFFTASRTSEPLGSAPGIVGPAPNRATPAPAPLEASLRRSDMLLGAATENAGRSESATRKMATKWTATS
jgi:hypothetical protein